MEEIDFWRCLVDLMGSAGNRKRVGASFMTDNSFIDGWRMIDATQQIDTFTKYIMEYFY